MRDRYHAIIVGAGPAGVMAAVTAAARGPVLLCDSGPLPRDKSCGGMLNGHAQRFLSEYGRLPDETILDPSHVRFRYWDWDRDIKRPTSLDFINVDRRGFDEWLLSLLPDTVEVVPGCRCKGFEETPAWVDVVLEVDGEERAVRSLYLVGADGARSTVRRRLGVGSVANYVTLQDFVRLEASLEPWFDCIYTRGVGESFAYAYVVPKGDEAIVGSVHYPKTKRAHQHQDRLLDILRQDLPQLGASTRREAGVALSVRAPEDIVPGRGRILLAGEAGGFMSPSSGEGISYALNTGRLAGAAVATATGDALAAYTAATAPIADNIRRKLRWLPLMESRVGKFMAGFVPSPVVSRVTERL